MKRSEILYNAMSGISEDKIADAYEYRGYNKKRAVLRAVLKGAGIVAVFCWFIALSFILIKISGPKITDDPFTASTGAADSTGDIQSETENVYTDIDDDSFYGLSKEEAYEKYGILSFLFDVKMENAFDGTYIYGTTFYQTAAGNNTLSRYKYPDNIYPGATKIEPACTDPLCTHGNECPFRGANPLDVVCYEDRIYFATTDDNAVYVYDKNTNKSKKIISDCYDANFFEYNGSVYLSFTSDNEAKNDLIIYYNFYKISPGGKITELGKLPFSDIYRKYGIVYEDKYYIDYDAKVKDNKVTVSVLKRDLSNGEVSAVTEFECSRSSVAFDSALTFMLYNDKLIVRIYYHSQGDRKDRVGLIDIWLLDLKTGEKRLVCTPDNSVYGTYKTWCLYSQKCVMWQEPRLKEDDPLILHVLFPHTGEEKTYDLSKTVKDATGEDIPLDAYIMDNAYSAVRLRTVINERSYTFCEIDLENGNVRKYQISPE